MARASSAAEIFAGMTSFSRQWQSASSGDGGGVSNIDELYTLGLKQVRRYAFHERVETPILKHRLGDSAGVIGAAWIGK